MSLLFAYKLVVSLKSLTFHQITYFLLHTLTKCIMLNVDAQNGMIPLQVQLPPWFGYRCLQKTCHCKTSICLAYYLDHITTIIYVYLNKSSISWSMPRKFRSTLENLTPISISGEKSIFSAAHHLPDRQPGWGLLKGVLRL